MIELEPAMIYRLDVTGPVEASDGSAANPRRQFWQMTRATLEGRNIRATSVIRASIGSPPIHMDTAALTCASRFVPTTVL